MITFDEKFGNGKFIQIYQDGSSIGHIVSTKIAEVVNFDINDDNNLLFSFQEILDIANKINSIISTF